MSTVRAPGVTDKHLTGEFEQLFRDHSQFVYRTAYGVTGNAEDAEDVLQTIFARLVRRPIPDNLMKNPRAYLYRAAVNASLSSIRSRRRTGVDTVDPDTVEAPSAATQHDRDEDSRKHLLEALDTMTESDPGGVELLILRYFHKQSDAQIAKTMGKSRGAIALRLYHARKRLKKLLGPIFGEQL